MQLLFLLLAHPKSLVSTLIIVNHLPIPPFFFNIYFHYHSYTFQIHLFSLCSQTISVYSLSSYFLFKQCLYYYFTNSFLFLPSPVTILDHLKMFIFYYIFFSMALYYSVSNSTCLLTVMLFHICINVCVPRLFFLF